MCVCTCVCVFYKHIPHYMFTWFASVNYSSHVSYMYIYIHTLNSILMSILLCVSVCQLHDGVCSHAWAIKAHLKSLTKVVLKEGWSLVRGGLSWERVGGGVIHMEIWRYEGRNIREKRGLKEGWFLPRVICHQGFCSSSKSRLVPSLNIFLFLHQVHTWLKLGDY